MKIKKISTNHSGKERFIQLIDGKGRVVREQQVQNISDAQIHVEGLARGIYLLRITSSGTSVGYRIGIE